MPRRFILLNCLLAAVIAVIGCHSEAENAKQPSEVAAVPPEHVGSKSCRDCHEEFYQRWVTSHHGLAMQPFSADFARENLSAQSEPITAGGRDYRYNADGAICELKAEGDRCYKIAQVMGGKNVYYFLTPLERGRLQVLPLAYDVNKKAWYDTAKSGVRHFAGQHDEPLDWTDRLYTFNTACFNCHVSEIRTNYDLATDAYQTCWSEPGISCEACHGPGEKHVKAMMQRGSEGATEKNSDCAILRVKDLSTQQANDLCATCHAKLIPLSTNFKPGDRFFDHYDLIGLEHPDFYADGRDLGENYTISSWLQSPCAASGKLDCNHCHTPSGRMKFEAQQSNQSCMPCHATYVADPAAHGHHAPQSKGNDCVGCHMPMTHFAAMGRSDHSMRPPMPKATLAFGSPNACNLCHTDQDAAWAQQWVTKWYRADYQDETLGRGELIAAAKRQAFSNTTQMLAELKKLPGSEFYRASLVRLLRGQTDIAVHSAMLEALEDPSPLVRSSAATALGGDFAPDALNGLLTATADASRLVRIRAAMALAGVPSDAVTGEDRRNLERATAEFLSAMRSRADDWASRANLGAFYLERREFVRAVENFESAIRIEPRVAGPQVSMAIAYSNLQQSDLAEKCLRAALKLEPDNAAALFNLGLLLGEQGKQEEAETSLKAALKADPQLAAAAYNLGVLAADRSLDESISYCDKAFKLAPGNVKYAQTLAYYLRKKGDLQQAAEVLREAIERSPQAVELQKLLQEILAEQRGVKR